MMLTQRIGVPERILVIKLGALGDFIQALGPMAAIRAHHPGARIALLTTRPYVALARECPYFDEIWTDDKPKWYQISGWTLLRHRLNEGNFWRVYDLQNNDRTAFYLRLFSPRPQWVGAARGASHRNASPLRTAGHALDGHRQTLALAGIENITADTLSWMKADIGAYALRAPYVLLVPGASRPDKRWPAQHYAALARALSARGLQPVILGAPSENALADEICAGISGALNLAGQTTLPQIAALARGAAGAVGNDTGPMHLIAATGCKALVLFNKGGNPARHVPMGDAVSWLKADGAFESLAPETVQNALQTR